MIPFPEKKYQIIYADPPWEYKQSGGKKVPWYDNIPERPLEPPPLPPEEPPICPVCGKETDTFYKDKNGDIVGCGECIRSVDAWEESTYG